MFSFQIQWKVRTLISSLNQSNHKIVVSEINNIVKMQNGDNRLPIISALLDDIDVRGNNNEQKVIVIN